jgi:hypothetical protein
MKSSLLLIPFSLAVLGAHAANYAIPSGANSATIQSTINAAASTSGGNTVSFAAGTYNITQNINIPCPASPLIITGPSVAYQNPSAYTATLNGSVPGNWGFSVNRCATAITIEYLNWNGGEPSDGGGGFLYVASGASNVTVVYNYIHGNQASTSDAHEYDSLIWMDGDDSDPASLYDNNDTIAWNIMGATNDGSTTNADCGALANLYSYQGGTFDAIGGYCAAIGVHSSTNSLTINNNVIHYQEQGMKFFEGGSSAATFFYQNNQNIIANDLSYIHRITLESQQSPNGTNINNNSIHDQTNPAWGSWGFSVPEGPSVNCNNNVLIANVTNGSGGAGPGAVEFWGGGACNNNLVQGFWGAGLQFGFGNAGWSISNNIIQHPANTSYINNEENIGGGFPTMTGNSLSQTLSAQVSAAPTISPSTSGTYAGSILVSLADAGNTSGTGPQGNTRVFYTTDGSIPTTSSKLYTVPFSVSPGTTVKAIGMWGAANQPTSYAPGYGFVPSAVVAAAYAGAAGAKTTPTMASISLGSTANTVGVGGTLQVSATGVYSDGSSAPIAGAAVSWSSDNSSIFSMSGSGLVTGIAAGVADVVARVGGLSSSPWPVTVTANPTAAPTLVSAYLDSAGNTLVVGGSLPFTAVGIYSDGSSATIPNSAINWVTNDSAILSVSSSGSVTAVGAGAASVQAIMGSRTSSPWIVTVSPAPAPAASTPTLSSAYLDATGNTLVAGRSLQFSAIGVYSDGSTNTIPNSATNWITNNPAVMTVNSSGLVTGVSTGVASVQAIMGTQYSSPWIVTVSAVPAATPTQAAPGVPLGDTFVGPFWKAMTAAGGSTSMSNGHLFLNVPGGANHDTLLPSNQAVRMVQAVGNYSFDVSIKIDSTILATAAGTSQGLMVLSNGNDFLSFGLAPDGTNIHLVVETVVGGVATKAFDDTNFSQYQNPIYLRLTRTNSAYVAFYSVDGTNWKQVVSFTDPKIPTAIGPYASNYADTPANAIPVVMAVNWFNVD